MVKTEVLNWDGAGPNGTNGTVYSVTVNAYNARDQITRVNQYAGAATSDGSCPSGTCQETIMSYDGHGRLKTRHLPEQQVDPSNGASTDHTTWDYYPDNTIQKVTDARGATSTFGYNNRHLLTGITHAAPTGITATPIVNFAYDAAGNRTSMSDGLGSKSYQYDQLSRLTSETRTINGVGTFPLNYAYNVGGELTSITDPFGANVGYQYDNAGRLNRVTGSGLGVAEYISQIDYRAWGGAKRLIYGNNLTTNLTYNSRLLASRYQGLQASNVRLGAEYQYYADGRVRYSQDLTDNRMDRSYVYDHAARTVQAQSGAEARAEPPTDDRPYRQAYSYDEWDNPTLRASRHWTEDFNFSASYLNNRNSQYNYDAEGNYTGHEDAMTQQEDSHAYDAAGFETASSDHDFTGLQITRITARGFDGDGQMVKEEISSVCPTCLPSSPGADYFIRSSVLGGQLVATLDNQGHKILSYVYADGQLIASRGDFYGQQGAVEWRHSAPSGSTQWRTYASFGGDGSVGRLELDPVGADAGTENPYLGSGGNENTQPNGDLTSRLADIADFSRCYLDGIRMPCSITFKNSDAVERGTDGVRTISFRNHDTGEVRYRLGTRQLLPDGGWGYVPIGARFDEGNYFSVSIGGDAKGIGRIHAIAGQDSWFSGSGRSGPQKSGVEFLPNPVGGSYGDKNRAQIRSIIDSLLQNERCRRAFAIVGLQTINQTVENGVVIGPATLLNNPANNGMMGITEGARRAYSDEFGKSSARGATINKMSGQPNPFSSRRDQRPRMFFSTFAFSGDQSSLREDIVHEFIHGGGQPPISSWFGHDLSNYEWHDFLQESCR